MIKNYRFESARIKIRPVRISRTGVVEIIASGLVCKKAFDYFRYELSRCLTDVPSYVLRLDGAVMTLDYGVTQVDAQKGRVCSRVAAIVVQPEQYAFWVAYCEKLLESGYPCNVFVASRSKQAYAFAEHQARVSA